MPNIGPLELIVVLVVVLLIFGPKRLPGLGRQLGGGMREFKDSLTGSSKDDDRDEDADAERRPALTAAEPVEPAAPRRTTADADATPPAERH
jgi:sec-independent protein translocase protein TatA